MRAPRIQTSSELGLLPPPLWGRAGEGGGAVKIRMAPPAKESLYPRPQRLPSRLRACPLPANPKVTKPGQAGVWLGRGAHRVRGNNIFQAQQTDLALRRAAPQPQLRTIQIPLRTLPARPGMVDAADVPAAPAAPIWPTGADYPIVRSPVSFAATGQPMVLGHIQRRDFMTPRGSAAAWPRAVRARARGVQPVGWCSPPAQRDVPHSDGVIP